MEVEIKKKKKSNRAVNLNNGSSKMFIYCIRQELF